MARASWRKRNDSFNLSIMVVSSSEFRSLQSRQVFVMAKGGIGGFLSANSRFVVVLGWVYSLCCAVVRARALVACKQAPTRFMGTRAICVRCQHVYLANV